VSAETERWLNDQAARAERERQEENAGHRVADDCHCPGCGARGYRFLCQNCRGA
jgi:hypothetical protein